MSSRIYCASRFFLFSFFRRIALQKLFFLGTVLLASACFFGGCAHIAKERASSVKWQRFSEEKLSAALKKEKPVLVVATAAWCTACNWMKSTTFADEDIVTELNDSFIVFALDADTAPESAVRFLKDGIPATYVLQKGGKVKGVAVAYRNAEDYGAFLKDMR